MATTTFTTGDAVLGTFGWFLDGHPMPTNVAAATPLLPAQLAELHQACSVETSEVLALFAWCRILSRQHPELSARSQLLSDALDIPSAFLALCQEAEQRVASDLDATNDIQELLDHPPKRILQTITGLVVTYLRNSRSQRTKVEGIASALFEHPEDRLFLDRFKSIPGAGRFVGTMVDIGTKFFEARLLGGAIEVTETSVPWLYKCYAEACDLLEIERLRNRRKLPPLYVEMAPLNAYTVGADEPIVAISASMVSLFDRDELLFAFGHELGHIHAGHVKYHTVGAILRSFGDSAIPGAGIAKFGGDVAFGAALYAWSRRSEFTADRCGLLACQEREIALRALMKMAGYPPLFYSQMHVSSLVRQADAFRDRIAADATHRVAELAAIWNRDHPWIVKRATELLNWLRDGSYAEVMEANREQRQRMAARIVADSAAQELSSIAAGTVIGWAAEHFGVRRKIAGPIVRRMLGEGSSPAGTPLEPLLRVELQAVKQAANEIRYSVLLLCNEQGKALRYTLALPIDDQWDNAPAEFRKEMIGSPKHELVWVLYSCGAEQAGVMQDFSTERR
ncbi:MAG: M48 family metallopeptidase [Planctomycetota bacterium]